MGDPFIGEIRMFGGNFAPVGWAFCDGALLSIAQYDTLFSLIGTTYGGDGQTTFALPNLQSRVPVHAGQGPGLSSYQLGQMGGVEEVTLTVQQLAAHSHPALASPDAGTTPNPAGGLVATSNVVNLYSGDPPDVSMAGQAIGPAGGNQPHVNIQPYLTISFIIALYGIFPGRN